MTYNKAKDFASAKRIVVKIGSGVLTEDNGLNIKAIMSISEQICSLMNKGLEVIIVSSGAMASGTKKIGLPKRPEDIPGRQAVAAVGQAGLILEYEKAFVQHNKKVAQILLTGEDLSHRTRYLNARNVMLKLLSWGVVPIINENDTVAVEEIKFGDNDNLSASITLLMDADILINLTDIDGFYDKDPRQFSDAKLISVVSEINKTTKKMASAIPGALGAGGMLSKIRAAQKVTASGIPMIIAKGREPHILFKLFANETYGTFFIPKEKKMALRKCWLAFTAKPRGIIRIDDGAAVAILKKGKSLLPSGIIGVEGDFNVGAPVEFATVKDVLGTGLVNYSAADIRKIMGLKSSEIKGLIGCKPYDEVIHRDNLAITSECEV